jgi:hypothetical protein
MFCLQAMFQHLSNEEVSFRAQHSMEMGSLRCNLSAQLPVAAASLAVSMSELAGCLTSALSTLPAASELYAVMAGGVTPVFAGRHPSVRLPESMKRQVSGASMSQTVLAALAGNSNTSMTHELFASFEMLRYSAAVNRFMSLLLEGDTQAFALEACKDLIAANAIDVLRSQNSVLTNVRVPRTRLLLV